MYKRPEFKLIKSRLEEPRRFIQVITGPRQIGKSTVVKQVLKEIGIPFLNYSADNIPWANTSWISECWAAARAMKDAKGCQDFLLVIDEIQKITNWSEAVKKEWDADTFNDVNIKVLLLGSSRVMIERGLSDSMAGRFEEIRMTHWSYPEMRDAFGLTLEQYAFYGGYPGAVALLNDPDRFIQYIQSSIIDSTINKDILMNSPVSKPALLRQTFELGAAYSGELLSLTKMLGMLQDAGNTSTLMSYLNLLNDSGLIGGLQKFSIDKARQKSSIPKLQVYNNALKSVYLPLSFEQALLDRKTWGRIFESSIGTHLINMAFKHRFDVYYWRDRNFEVDFVIKKHESIAAIEVKSNGEKSTDGLEEFRKRFSPKHAFIVGDGGVSANEFLSMDVNSLL